MDYFNPARIEAMFSGKYICSQCGAVMEWEDKWEDSLVCLKCGHSVGLDSYGCESDEEYDAMYPLLEDLMDDGYEDDEYHGEYYEEECDELSHDD